MGLFDGIAFNITDATTKSIDDAKSHEAGGNAITQMFAGVLSGGFSLDKDQATTMLAQAKKMRLDLRAIQNKAEFLEKMSAPAQDPVSVAYTKAATWQGADNPGAFAYGSGHIRLEVLYLSEIIDRLDKALGLTEAADDQAGADVGKAGAGTEGTI